MRSDPTAISLYLEALAPTATKRSFTDEQLASIRDEMLKCMRTAQKRILKHLGNDAQRFLDMLGEQTTRKFALLSDRNQISVLRIFKSKVESPAFDPVAFFKPLHEMRVPDPVFLTISL